MKSILNIPITLIALIIIFTSCQSKPQQEKLKPLVKHVILIGSDGFGAYAFKKLLDTYGMVALGTDYPVEKVDPFLTFYAAVVRQDTNGYPEGGYQMENALSREETLKGMTIWAAYANFEENEKGSIEVGKFADFVILDQNIMEIEGSKIPKTKAKSTYINGEKVY